jgi:hypothetical protein
VLGVSLTQHDDGSRPGMFDFLVNFSDARKAAIEVVTDTQPESAELAAAIRRYKLTPNDNPLRYDWSVTVKTAAKLRQLRNELPGVLFEIEQCLMGPDFPSEVVQDFERQLRILGVEYARALNEREEAEGGISVEAHNFRYGSMDPNSIADRCSAMLNSAELQDVRDKLARSGCEERHVALVFSLNSRSTVGSALSKGVIPTKDPILPAEITHVWAISGSLDEAAAYWSDAEKWRFSRIALKFSGSGRIGPIHVVLNADSFRKPDNWSITDPASGTLILPHTPLARGASEGP